MKSTILLGFKEVHQKKAKTPKGRCKRLAVAKNLRYSQKRSMGLRKSFSQEIETRKNGPMPGPLERLAGMSEWGAPTGGFAAPAPRTTELAARCFSFVQTRLENAGAHFCPFVRAARDRQGAA